MKKIPNSEEEIALFTIILFESQPHHSVDIFVETIGISSCSMACLLTYQDCGSGSCAHSPNLRPHKFNVVSTALQLDCRVSKWFYESARQMKNTSGPKAAVSALSSESRVNHIIARKACSLSVYVWTLSREQHRAVSTG